MEHYVSLACILRADLLYTHKHFSHFIFIYASDP